MQGERKERCPEGILMAYGTGCSPSEFSVRNRKRLRGSGVWHGERREFIHSSRLVSGSWSKAQYTCSVGNLLCVSGAAYD